MADQTEEQLAESDRMLQAAVAALDLADSQLLETDLEHYVLPNWSEDENPSSPLFANNPCLKNHQADSRLNDPQSNPASEELRIQIGQTKLALKDLYQLSDNALLVLDSAEQDLVDLFVGTKLIAKGEILCMNGRICFRVAQLLDPRSPDQ